MNNFKCLRTNANLDGSFTTIFTTLKIEELPKHDTLIKVSYSSLNYKDALSSSGNRGVTRNFPHTPGIDAAGIVESSTNPKFTKGDKVIVTGFDLGMNTHGGLSEYICVPSEWIVPLPQNLSLKESMCWGTAGLTAAMSILHIVNNSFCNDKPILVTGAGGGVGSIAVKLLHKLGYSVTTATRDQSKANFLKEIGASECLTYEELMQNSHKLILKETYGGVVDTVGGDPLAHALKLINFGGVATTCGNIAGHELNSNVYPFILRGISLQGIASADSPQKLKATLWEKMANEWRLDHKDGIQTINLEESIDHLKQMLAGNGKGRTIVEI